MLRAILLLGTIASIVGVACLDSDAGPRSSDAEEQVNPARVAAAATTAPPVTTRFAPEADAMVRSGSDARVNFGAAAALQSDSRDGRATVQSYLRFSIPNLGAIVSAKLRLYATDGSAGPHLVKKAANAQWDEARISWSNRPAVDGPTLATIGKVGPGTWIEVDVTKVAAPNSVVSLAIVPRTNDGLDLGSRSSEHPPELVIVSRGIPTRPNLKVAIVGDTSDGPNYQRVLNLVRAEGAQALLTTGDMTYTDDPAAWWAATEAVLGQDFPVFLARGNHDDISWTGFLPEAANHLGGATRVPGPHDGAYKTVFQGLDIATISRGDTAATIAQLFGDDANIWKLCTWHENQNKMQLGGKSDEMGWAVYEECRRRGAIILTGHEHTYHRTRTLRSITAAPSIDATCASGDRLCVGPGRTFVTVIGTGGASLRPQIRCLPSAPVRPFPSLNATDPSCPIWAAIYTTHQNATFGAQFMVFNVDGNPNKARGYFKDVGGSTIDVFEMLADR